jgi:hypothetical protein
MPVEEPMAQVPAPIMAEAAGREDLAPYFKEKHLNEKRSMEKMDLAPAEVQEHYYDPASASRNAIDIVFWLSLTISPQLRPR